MYIPSKETIIRKKMMDSIDTILDQYVSDKYLNDLITEWVAAGEGVEVVKHIPEFVPKSAFTPAQIKFMETDPAWKVLFPEGKVTLKRDPNLAKTGILK